MIFVQTQECYRLQQCERQRQLAETIRQRQLARIHPIEEIIRDVLSENAQPMRITSVANAALQHMDWRGRTERDARILEVFALVGKLIKVGKLERVRRKYIAVPESDNRYREYVMRIDRAVAGFQPPRI